MPVFSHLHLVHCKLSAVPLHGYRLLGTSMFCNCNGMQSQAAVLAECPPISVGWPSDVR